PGAADRLVPPAAAGRRRARGRRRQGDLLHAVRRDRCAHPAHRGAGLRRRHRPRRARAGPGVAAGGQGLPLLGVQRGLLPRQAQGLRDRGPRSAGDLVEKLAAAVDRDRFVVQAMIPGDDTAMLSVTAYVDTRGEVTLLGGAQVLLEEHTPGALGNPAAMFTTDLPDVLDQSVRFLQHTGYRGYANFDVKIDPRDRVAKFFEVNPRIGRNNYYMTAAGANVAEPVVADLVEGRALPRMVPHREVLYSIVPWALLRRYVLDPALRARVRAIGRRATVHPLAYPVEGLK